MTDHSHYSSPELRSGQMVPPPSDIFTLQDVCTIHNIARCTICLSDRRPLEVGDWVRVIAPGAHQGKEGEIIKTGDFYVVKFSEGPNGVFYRHELLRVPPSSQALADEPPSVKVGTPPTPGEEFTPAQRERMSTPAVAPPTAEYVRGNVECLALIDTMLGQGPRLTDPQTKVDYFALEDIQRAMEMATALQTTPRSVPLDEELQPGMYEEFLNQLHVKRPS